MSGLPRRVLADLAFISLTAAPALANDKVKVGIMGGVPDLF